MPSCYQCNNFEGWLEPVQRRLCQRCTIEARAKRRRDKAENERLEKNKLVEVDFSMRWKDYQGVRVLANREANGSVSRLLGNLVTKEIHRLMSEADEPTRIALSDAVHYSQYPQQVRLKKRRRK